MSRVFSGVTGNYLSIASELVTDYPVSMVAWIKPDDVSSTTYYFHVSLNGSDGLKLWSFNTGTRFTDANDGIKHATLGPKPNINEWQLLIGTASSSEIKIDGDVGSAGPTSITGTWPVTSSDPFVVVGARDQFFDNVVSGKMANVAIFSGVLSAQNITDLKAGVAPDSLTSGPTLVEYWALEDSSLTGVNSNVLSVTGTVTVDTEDNPLAAAPTPVITSINGGEVIVSGATGVAIVCTGAEAAQGTGGVTQETIAVTETGWADLLVTIDVLTVESGVTKYGPHTFEVTNDSANSDSSVGTVVPGADKNFTDLVAPLATVGLRIDAIPDLIGNDQVRFGSVVFESDQTTPTAYTVAVQPDGSYVISGGPFIDGDYAFLINSWDSTDGLTPWGTEVWQTFTINLTDADLPRLGCHPLTHNLTG